MSKTQIRKPEVTITQIEAKANAYREVWLRKAHMEVQLKELRQEIGGYAEEYFTRHPDEKMTIRLGGCIIAHKLVTAVVVPEDMSHADDKKLHQFCRKYPHAVRFEIIKSRLGNIDLSQWGFAIAEGRKVEIQVADRGESAPGESA